MTQAPDQREQPLGALFEVWREEKGTRHYFFGRDVDLRARHPAVAGAAAHEAAFDAREEGECEILETDRVTFTVSTRDSFPGDLEEVQIRCGDVVVASTRAEGPHEALLVLEGGNALEARAFQPFLDCAGLTTVGLCVRWADEDVLQAVERVAVRVVPSKITPRELEQLMTELDMVSSGVLFDAYTKTYVGLRAAGAGRAWAPAEKLERIRAVLGLLGAELARIAHRPAQRLMLSPRRVDISLGESITPETIASLGEDPSLLMRTRTGLALRERVEMMAERDVVLPEHQAISGFLAVLEVEVREIMDLIRSEIDQRLKRKRFFAPGDHGIWAEREEPKIQSLRDLEARARVLLSRSKDLRRRHDFLPAEAPPLYHPPELTKRFAHAGAYSVLYRAMREHFLEQRVDPDNRSVLVGARSLPVLWEYWVVLKVVEFLQRTLRFSVAPWESASSIYRRVIGSRDRYSLDLASERRLDFVDAEGRRILLRYQPRYWTMRRRGELFGRLRAEGAPFEPDISIEIYARGAQAEAAAARPGPGGDALPEHIVILDAKYTTRRQEEVLQSILRYRNIGEFGTGRRLARHVWALTNAPRDPDAHVIKRAGSGEDASRLEEHATVDNEAFFVSGFSAAGETCGVLCLRPEKRKAEEPLHVWLRSILEILQVTPVR
ncbi:MAG TPA: nuclease domain-containing protein [Planctomycetota bacterium]|nr:nuclease domain-containing protein [Planctomycetota bacterium]